MLRACTWGLFLTVWGRTRNTFWKFCEKSRIRRQGSVGAPDQRASQIPRTGMKRTPDLYHIARGRRPETGQGGVPYGHGAESPMRFGFHANARHRPTSVCIEPGVEGRRGKPSAQLLCFAGSQRYGHGTSLLKSVGPPCDAKGCLPWRIRKPSRAEIVVFLILIQKWYSQKEKI